ncbi:Transposase [Shigella dysenteriae 1617]|uniref:Transposase n=1 Tax=Shigella dysenteriae 1617 TaxID=754093 RepID=A0A0A6ZNX7_SHIDY|nr:Transposase [Shigella dysenteriae 1617]
MPKDKHLTGKIFTQRIERNNLTLRTRIKRLARKTICFSRSVEIHEKVIGTFIEKHMFPRARVVLKSVELHDKVSRALSRTIKHYTIS